MHWSKVFTSHLWCVSVPGCVWEGSSSAPNEQAVRGRGWPMVTRRHSLSRGYRSAAVQTIRWTQESRNDV